MKTITKYLFYSSLFASLALSGCTKYGDGFISPYMQYAVNQFTIIRGRTATSYSLITDGSSTPMHVKWTHIYDEAGNVMDSIFTKEYPVAVWTAAYNPLTDNDYASIAAKRSVANMPPIVVNESNGTIEANPGTLNIPAGTYSMDLEVTNAAGTQALKNIMQLVIQDGQAVELAPETGTFRNQLALAGSAPPVIDIYNSSNNPFDKYTLTRFADTPNIFILKVTDKNGMPFNPRTGELTKRPNTGLDPVPPYLQNLQDYAPDTYTTSDTAISIKYPLVPFPILSLGNGYNMYYNIPAANIIIDSTALWSGNTDPSAFYQGITDSHYLGAYADGRYDAFLRIPMRIQVPGAYELSIKVLNLTHK